MQDRITTKGILAHPWLAAAPLPPNKEKARLITADDIAPVLERSRRRRSRRDDILQTIM